MNDGNEGGKSRKGCGFYALVAIGLVVALGVIGTITGPSEAERAAEAENARNQAVADATEVTAQDLWAAYDRNEVAAQAAYGDRPLLVSGTISGITLDFMDEPVVSLETGNQFQSVQVDLDKEDAARVASLSAGEVVEALCMDVSEIAGTPMLRDCEIR